MIELSVKEFEEEFEIRIKRLQDISKQEQQRINDKFDQLISSFPQELLDISIKEFFEVYKGSVPEFLESQKQRQDVEESMNKKNKPAASKASSKTKTKKAAKNKNEENVQEEIVVVDPVQETEEPSKPQRTTRRRKQMESQTVEESIPVQASENDIENDENIQPVSVPEEPPAKKLRGRKKKADDASNILAESNKVNTRTTRSTLAENTKTPDASPKSKRMTRAGAKKPIIDEVVVDELVEATPRRSTRRGAAQSSTTATATKAKRGTKRQSTQISPMPASGPSETIFDLYNKQAASSDPTSVTRRITLRASMAPGKNIPSRESIIPSLVVPLDDGVVLDLDPTVSADMLKSSVGEESRKQVLDHVKSVRDQLNSLLASLAE